MNTQKQHSVCTDYHQAIEFLGKRWTGIIIYTLMDGPKRYIEIMESIDGISDRLLTNRLDELIKEGLIIKHVHHAKNVTYELTEHGRAVEKVIIALKEWVSLRKEDPQ